ncbi:hypothetical protein [uncultured Duncaniella sp.]|uniref:hypothetical protein n=1 Tax=uncultured Duncaniella sp. TaxID=2768039 RepID=UPI002624960A|nr:hypothetical protein [uncultured Duncaniella sp.]
MNEDVIKSMVSGADTSLTDEMKRRMEDSIRTVSRDITAATNNRSANAMFGKAKSSNQTPVPQSTDSQIFTSISEMINGTDRDPAGFGTLLDSLYQKNKKYYAIIKDYEIMPILIPQINRVLMFLVNECLSPDIQNDATFAIKYIGADSTASANIQKNIEEIKKEMKLDNLLRDVYMNRYKLGHEYYLVVDYSATFEHMKMMLQQKGLVEGAGDLSDIQYLEGQYSALSETIDNCSVSLAINQQSDPSASPNYTGTKMERENLTVQESTINLSFDHLNIVVERSGLAQHVEKAHAELLAEAYSGLRMKDLMTRMTSTGSLNEAVTDTSKLVSLVTNLQRKKLQRCTIERLDPAKVFQLKVGGKIIGYFVITDINENTSNVVNFAQALKDQLLKSRAVNLNATTKSAEEVISKELAERIVNTFDPNIGISRIEDIDLLHSFIRNNEVYKGNKRITFYYEDEIYDMSRADGSILTNGVFFTKLYATLLLNNIMTKVLRGRGRQIHTVHLGASPNVQRYLQNAMASLTMPENNLGTLHGSFEQIMNPFNSASDIIIPTDDENGKYIETDYIPGQDVNMDDEFLRSLLNAIVSSFGLDSAVIDATNGNLQFARTLSMESLQICNSVRNEQQDLHDSWEAMCLAILSIMGSDETKKAVSDGKIEVDFFEPKSLILQNTIDDINNAKTYAEALADVTPQFNEDGAELNRSKFIYKVVQDRTNVDWAKYEELISELGIESIPDALDAQIRKLIAEYMENIKEEVYGDANNDGIVTSDDTDGGDSGLTAEEQDLLSSPDEEPEDGTDEF